MRRLEDLSIPWKLKLIIMITSLITLTLASISFVIKDSVIFRKAIREDVASLARVVGYNSEGALVFDDRITAEKNLAALRAKPHVMFACIFHPDGKVFASYARDGKMENVRLPEPRKTGHYFDDDYLFLFQEIMLEDDMIGTVFIQYDLEEMMTKMFQAGSIFTGIIMVVVVVAWVLTSMLQGTISQPILDLARTARSISREKDYSARAEKNSRDELGVLIDDFNQMLAEIQARDIELASHRERELKQHQVFLDE